MIISDLNYMEVAAEEVAGSRGINVNSNGFVNFGANIDVDEDIFKKITVDTSGISNGSSTAQVTGTSDASGFSTFSNIVFFTQTDPGRSESGVNATSVSNRRRY